MRHAWDAAYARLGHRGLFLLLLGLVQVIYGAGLLAADHDVRHEHWWPASVGNLGGFPLDMWGTVWVLIGVLCLITSWTTTDRVSFAAAVLLNTGWAAFAVQRWIATAEAGSWAPAAIYTGIAVGVFLVSGWPDIPKPPPGPPPGAGRELPPPPTTEDLAWLADLTRGNGEPGPPA